MVKNLYIMEFYINLHVIGMEFMVVNGDLPKQQDVNYVDYMQLLDVVYLNFKFHYVM